MGERLYLYGGGVVAVVVYLFSPIICTLNDFTRKSFPSLSVPFNETQFQLHLTLIQRMKITEKKNVEKIHFEKKYNFGSLPGCQANFIICRGNIHSVSDTLMIH